jgi:hypothetical protein
MAHTRSQILSNIYVDYIDQTNVFDSQHCMIIVPRLPVVISVKMRTNTWTD